MKIDYNYSSLTLVDIDALDNSGCPRVHHNLTLNDDLPLEYSMLDLYLNFYYNCIHYPNSYFAHPLDCLNSSGNKSYYAEEEDFDWYRICEKKVVVPVTRPGPGSGDGLTRGVGAAMREGFLLHWVNATECVKCEASDGRCGYNNSTQESLCYCKDGTIQFDNYNTKVSGKRRLGLKVAAGLGTAGIILVAAYGLICCMRFRKTNKKPKREDHNIEAFQRQYGSLAPTAYRYSDIKKMTNSFKEKLGEGGYGWVYKGNLNGHPVAVKILKETKGNGEEFINEVASISRTSHVNIVTLLGFCLNRKEKALIYEFMPNGSLDKHIYNQDSNMGWEMLYKIALGIARGLEYLHRGCNSRILHFDIKPHNILLDEDFCPKISDFGLAKLSTRKESIMSMLEARGTIGYIAPEVFSRNFGGVSHKSDVYSYGMMVLEMV